MVETSLQKSWPIKSMNRISLYLSIWCTILLIDSKTPSYRNLKWIYSCRQESYHILLLDFWFLKELQMLRHEAFLYWVLYYLINFFNIEILKEYQMYKWLFYNSFWSQHYWLDHQSDSSTSQIQIDKCDY
jgi:hypothetical protein